jgi:hypothetical protein
MDLAHFIIGISLGMACGFAISRKEWFWVILFVGIMTLNIIVQAIGL